MFYQLIKNLFSMTSRPAPRLGRQWKELKLKGQSTISPIPLIFNHNRNKVPKYHSLPKYQNLLHKLSICDKRKTKPIGRLSNFRRYPFIFPGDDLVSDTDNLFWFHTNACFVVTEKVSKLLKLHGRFRCHIWIQYRLCINLNVLIYVHSMFHLHSPTLCYCSLV